MNKSRIAWTDFTWSPVTGCTKVSPGCANCYAEAYHRRFHDGDFAVKLHPGKLREPIHGLRGFQAKYGRRPRVFVCPMADLFHDEAPESYLALVFSTMEQAKHIDFLILTKRPERMRSFMRIAGDMVANNSGYHQTDRGGSFQWPLPNVWLGVTAENQKQADSRIPVLLDTPAAIRFASVEPMLEWIDMPFQQYPDGASRMGVLQTMNGWRDQPEGKINWIICGGESGPKARSMGTEWVRSLRDQCAHADVPFYFKQWDAQKCGPINDEGMPILDGAVHDAFPRSVA